MANFHVHLKIVQKAPEAIVIELTRSMKARNNTEINQISEKLLLIIIQ